ncbi:MAG: tRNA guanosine(34) transglycosylase Tgt [Ignavibacteriales bacterium]|nr:tRNA guanosine(34) transglycosylase Tgt [Ignavibacteriales bacterium]
MKFSLNATDGQARAGRLETGHGVIETPVFLPVGTQGTVKAIEHRELQELGAQIILGNTYHLYLRPGADVVRKAGGLHRFIGWQGPILTDSGGYQVFSLTDLRTIEENGVSFQSHLDGSPHVFTPESVIQIQRVLGSDIIMVLDECTPYPCDETYARTSHELTARWADRCRSEFQRSEALYGHDQGLFGIVQGSVYPHLRRQSAEVLAGMDFDGYAVGGLAVGEPVTTMYEMIETCEPVLPASKLRYLMGVGTPENLLEAIERGMDMFDCVLPTRNGRNGTVFTRTGSLNLRNAAHKTDFTPIDADCRCYTCLTFTRAYVRHLFQVREILALQLATIHNLAFYFWLMREARTAILNKRFHPWKADLLDRLESEAGILS